MGCSYQARRIDLRKFSFDHSILFNSFYLQHEFIYSAILFREKGKGKREKGEGKFSNHFSLLSFFFFLKEGTNKITQPFHMVFIDEHFYEQQNSDDSQFIFFGDAD